jgi:hypothetical protein
MMPPSGYLVLVTASITDLYNKHRYSPWLTASCSALCDTLVTTYMIAVMTPSLRIMKLSNAWDMGLLIRMGRSLRG